MSLKPVLVVIPQRTLRLLSGLGSTRNGCPPVLVARRQANSGQRCSSEVQLCGPGGETITGGKDSSGSPQVEPSVGEEEGEGSDGGVAGGSGDEGMESEDVTSVAPSRAVKHKAVEQRRKKKISEAVQQLLEALQPPSPAGKMTRVDILERAVDKIKSLKEENEQLKSKIDNLPQPGRETELYDKLSKRIAEFLALKSQLLEHMEKQRCESHDLETESHDLGIESHDSIEERDQTVISKDPLPSTCATCNPPQTSTVITMTSSSNSTSTASNNSSSPTSCSVAHVHIHSPAPSLSSAISTTRTVGNGHSGETSKIVNARADEAPPPNSTHQPWPVTSILSQGSTSHCQHAATTNNNVVPTGCHGNSSLTTNGGQSSPSMAARNLPALSSFSSVPARITNSHFHQPDRTLTLPINTITSTSVCLSSSSMPSSSQQRSDVTNHHLGLRAQPGRNATTHSRTGSGLTSLHGNYQYLSNEQQQVIMQCRHSGAGERQREGCIGYTPSNQTEHYHSSTAQIQPHTSSIVQPWVESSHRPRPLHHVTNATPRISPQYSPLQHHQEQHRHNIHSHAERFVPYPRVNHRNSSSTFSPGSWSHDNHVITPGTSGRDVAPQGRIYASPYDLHQQHFTTPLGGRSYISNYDYSRNYSTSQGHPSSTQGAGHSSWMQYFTPSQQNSSSSRMMSHGTQATHPYPIQPHPHGSGSSGTSSAVWRPYSERSRSSGFCLADILSLPSETEAPPLSLEVTPPTGHHSFLVNRLLDDI